MEAAAQSRKEKLAALRKRKADEDAGMVSRDAAKPRNMDDDEGMDEGLLIKRSFRNYDPKNRQMKKTAAGQGIEDTVEQAVEGLQERVLKEDEAKRQEELDLLNIAPKRPNWDLKRDLKKRLGKVERKDKETILVLIRASTDDQRRFNRLP
ncbi:hypothetical protein K437DRAFT_97238 [Tilletiaria anomala UBC 951]|uniref:mRNA splicing factor n=1 Tax=Tilletiaria anomala (strain ATCC 24038 / CBS 436.72 / UBC 951) TaxID=1037660 RepID=A0A066WRJ2_TILAU|nr:uncharacterized protein K437DRAFT_97238 [Tilletiaria anomala UBC 951]KDN53280.1 hypothetical protein K437DRAFT_97238 [Tilletiaria anomala UBC 951]